MTYPKLLGALLPLLFFTCTKEPPLAVENISEPPEDEIELIPFHNDSIHVATVQDQDSVTWKFEAYARFEPYGDNGLYPLTLIHRYVPGVPSYLIALDITLPSLDSIGCYTLTKAHRRDIFFSIDYPSALFTPVEEDAVLDPYQLSEVVTSNVCITEVFDNGLEYSGTFDLTLIKPVNDPRFPWLEWQGQDSLSFKNGVFRAGQLYY